MAISETFKKLKQRINREALIKSLVFGLSFGTFLTGALLIILKLCKVKLAVPYYILIGVGSAAVVAGVLFLILRRNDKGVARKLDAALSLPEKVQTMVEYSDKQGEMIELQRSDAEKILRNAPKGASFFKRFRICMLAAALAAATFVVGGVLPSVPSDNPNVSAETPFEITEWQLRALNELIENVKSADCKMQQEAKTPTVAALENLHSVLQGVELRSEMKAAVIIALTGVDAAVEAVNSYKTLCPAIYKSTDAQVKYLAKTIAELSRIGYSDKLYTIEEAFSEGELSANIDAFTTELNLRLGEAEADEEDVLLLALRDFADGLATVSAEIKAGTSDDAQSKSALHDVFSDSANGIGAVLSQQYENRSARNTIKTKLMEIFKLTDADLPQLPGDVEPNLKEDSAGENDGDEKEGEGGGLGDGDTLYGSNDTIYDPYGETGGGYVQYGESLEKHYYEKILALLQDSALDDETKQYINDYFMKLSNGGNTEDAD